MRKEADIFQMILQFANQDERIRLVTLEGSRANPAIPDDGWKDYDLSFFVTEMDSFKTNDEWLDEFGKRLILQKPETMELYPPELGNWFSYLMLFEDGNKLDLTLIPLAETADYFDKSDGLVEVLLDKDQRIVEPPVPTDQYYWLQPPNVEKYQDCCNEFWWLTTYVAKGLVRGEFLFAADHLNRLLRPALLQMMAWEVGSRLGYEFSLGKHYKFIHKFIPEDKWTKLVHTFSMEGVEQTWQALFGCCQLFREYSQAVSQAFDYPYPNYDEKITPYLKGLKK